MPSFEWRIPLLSGLPDQGDLEGPINGASRRAQPCQGHTKPAQGKQIYEESPHILLAYDESCHNKLEPLKKLRSARLRITEPHSDSISFKKKPNFF